MRTGCFTIIFCFILFQTSCSDSPSNHTHSSANSSAKAKPQPVKLPAYDSSFTEENNTSQAPLLTPDHDFSIEYLMGQFDPSQHPDFVMVEKKYADAEGYYLRKDTYDAFKQMWEAAQADGITLTIISATRNFNRQKQIWEAKWTGERLIENGSNASKKYPDPKIRALKILEYSSMPGTSRHHWGTDIDLNDLDNYTFEKGEGKKVYEWLRANAAEFGFCQPYSPKGKNRPNGYNEEKWHWSYLPVAKLLTNIALRSLKDEMIGGFMGAETASEIGVVERYVLGINKECL